MKVEFYKHNLSESHAQSVAEVLGSTFLTTGPVTDKFEREFSRFAGLKHTVGVTSCTAALHLALLALGIGHGDEVITTPMTFVATANSIIYTGARPVFVDVDADTGLMDVSRIENAITSKTKAILPVHLYGSMVDMKALRNIADAYSLKIVEDCAHCIEGEFDGVRPGQLGDGACYSFYATKNITCGEGGAVATNDSELAEKVKLLRSHGMTKSAALRYAEPYKHWDMVALGWKYNMDDIRASLLVGQTSLIDKFWEERARICGIYDDAFSRISGIRIPKIRGKSARHLYTIWVDPRKRDDYLHKLQDMRIGIAVNYRSIHTLTYYREMFGFTPEDFPIADLVGRSTISLPLYPRLGDSEIEYVIEGVKEVISV